MKFLLNFKQISESTSAFSQERAGWDFPPFKFAKNFDPRIGYSKDDFYNDLCSIYRELEKEKRDKIMAIVKEVAGIDRLKNIKGLNNLLVNKLMKRIEDFLKSKSEPVLKILPDGFVLCYENIKRNGRVFDVYYSPTDKVIKISYVDLYPENEELQKELNDFNSESFGIKKEDFESVMDKCQGLTKSSFVI